MTILALLFASFGLLCLLASRAKELPMPPHEISAFEIVASLSRIMFVRGPLDGHEYKEPVIVLSGQTCRVTVKSTGQAYLYRAIVTGWGTAWVHEYRSEDGVAADHVCDQLGDRQADRGGGVMDPIGHIVLATSREEENRWRIPRLHRVLGYVFALAERDGNTSIFDKIAGIEDWKGVLTVKWAVGWSSLEDGYFVRAWASEIGDCSPPEFVQHEMAEYTLSQSRAQSGGKGGA